MVWSKLSKLFGGLNPEQQALSEAIAARAPASIRLSLPRELRATVTREGRPGIGVDHILRGILLRRAPWLVVALPLARDDSPASPLKLKDTRITEALERLLREAEAERARRSLPMLSEELIAAWAFAAVGVEGDEAASRLGEAVFRARALRWAAPSEALELVASAPDAGEQAALFGVAPLRVWLRGRRAILEESKDEVWAADLEAAVADVQSALERARREPRGEDRLNLGVTLADRALDGLELARLAALQGDAALFTEALTSAEAQARTLAPELAATRGRGEHWVSASARDRRKLWQVEVLIERMRAEAQVSDDEVDGGPLSEPAARRARELRQRAEAACDALKSSKSCARLALLLRAELHLLDEDFEAGGPGCARAEAIAALDEALEGASGATAAWLRYERARARLCEPDGGAGVDPESDSAAEALEDFAAAAAEGSFEAAIEGGEMALQRGGDDDLLKAVALGGQAREARPEDPRGHAQLILAELARGELGKAREAYEAARERLPKSLPVLLAGLSIAREAEDDEAAAALEAEVEALEAERQAELERATRFLEGAS